MKLDDSPSSIHPAIIQRRGSFHAPLVSHRESFIRSIETAFRHCLTGYSFYGAADLNDSCGSDPGVSLDEPAFDL